MQKSGAMFLNIVWEMPRLGRYRGAGSWKRAVEAC